MLIFATCILASQGLATIYENLPDGIVPAGVAFTATVPVAQFQADESVVSQSSCIGICNKSVIYYIVKN